MSGAVRPVWPTRKGIFQIQLGRHGFRKNNLCQPTGCVPVVLLSYWQGAIIEAMNNLVEILGWEADGKWRRCWGPKRQGFLMAR